MSISVDSVNQFKMSNHFFVGHNSFWLKLVINTTTFYPPIQPIVSFPHKHANTKKFNIKMRSKRCNNKIYLIAKSAKVRYACIFNSRLSRLWGCSFEFTQKRKMYCHHTHMGIAQSPLFLTTVGGGEEGGPCQFLNLLLMFYSLCFQRQSRIGIFGNP